MKDCENKYSPWGFLHVLMLTDYLQAPSSLGSVDVDNSICSDQAVNTSSSSSPSIPAPPLNVVICALLIVMVMVAQ